MTSQRSLRRQARVCYFEPEEPSLDEYVFCEKCGDYVYEYCALHGPLLVIPDDKVPAKPNFPPYVPRAALTVPRVFLHLNYSSIPGAGLGVFTTLTLPCGVRFGPYRGERTNDLASNYSWKIYDRNRKPSHVIDASNGDKSNWMRYVNCSRHWAEQNLVAFQYRGELYYRTIRIIPKFTELMVFYGSEYANHLQIDLGKYNAPKAYAQKFGAPAPKKFKLGVEPTKLQEHIVPQNKPTETSATPVQILKPSFGVQGTSRNRKKSKEIEPELRTGVSATKKSKTEKKKTQLQQEVQRKNSDVTTLQTTDQIVENPSAINKIKHKNKKISKFVKPKSQKGTIDTNKEKEPPNIIQLNEPLTLECKNTNIDLLKPVEDNATSNENVLKNYNITVKEDHYTPKAPEKELRKVLEIGRKKNTQQIKPQHVYFICDTCNYQGITKERLQKHMIIHDTNRKFVCESCTFRCTRAYVLRQHLRTHTAEKPFSCDICDYKCKQAASLKRHLRTHTGEKPFSCDICDYKCTHAANLKRHLRTHTGEKPFSCDICDYKCTHVANLKRHVRTHTGEKPFSCDICDYKCKQAANLKSHLRTHTGEKPFSCDICDYKCTHAASLKSHLRTHTGEKPFSCDICDYKCTHAANLKTHLRTHTGEKPYSCDICDYKCTQAANLKKHLRTHTGEKPFSCDICDYKCTHAASLKKHLRTHTGEKPFSCDICDYKCIQASALKRHLITRHIREKPHS